MHSLLYFGTHRIDGVVTEKEWATFVEHTITPRFPAGLTFVSGSGQWQSGTGHIIREPSYVLSIVHPESEASEIAIAEVMQAYKTQFQQKAVLRLRNHTCVSY